MGKYILYIGMLWAALGSHSNAADGHLFSFRGGQDIRMESRAAVREDCIYKRLGEKKYLVLDGERIVLLDTERFAAERMISRGLVERIEREACKNLHKMGKGGALGESRKES